MNATRRAGFTLIELLTVIAIIAILAGMVFTVGPRMIERAKISRMVNAIRQINTALVAYSTDNKRGSYPPAYGFIGLGQVPPAPSDPVLDETYYHLRPYMALLKHHGESGLYDEFSESYDTNRDGKLSLLEFGPTGHKTPQGPWVFDQGLPRYVGTNAAALQVEMGRQLAKQPRPFIYVPVNSTQAKRAAKYWINKGDFLATTWDSEATGLRDDSFPPTKYDAFVLISVGPGGSTFGLLDDQPYFQTASNSRVAYHLAALRTYFLATRDLNANGKLDFDFNTRTKEGEGKLTYKVAPTNQACNNELPCDTPNGTGPWIYVSQ